MDKTVSVEEFASRYNVKAKTVTNNISLIKGAYKKDGKYLIPDSSRYPYFLHSNEKIESRSDKKASNNTCDKFI